MIKLNDGPITPEVKKALAIGPAKIIISPKPGLDSKLTKALEDDHNLLCTRNICYYMFVDVGSLEDLKDFVEGHEDLIDKVWLDKGVKAT